MLHSFLEARRMSLRIEVGNKNLSVGCCLLQPWSNILNSVGHTLNQACFEIGSQTFCEWDSSFGQRTLTISRISKRTPIMERLSHMCILKLVIICYLIKSLHPSRQPFFSFFILNKIITFIFQLGNFNFVIIGSTKNFLHCAPPLRISHHKYNFNRSFNIFRNTPTYYNVNPKLGCSLGSCTEPNSSRCIPHGGMLIREYKPFARNYISFYRTKTRIGIHERRCKRKRLLN